jgi:hypothetical protein
MLKWRSASEDISYLYLYSERYTRLNARKKVGDPFNPKKNEIFLSIKATFIHF